MSSPAYSWPQEDPSSRRDTIVAAAYRVFATRGYRAATIADIASELGIGHGTVYRSFNNKRDILVHVLDLVVERITSAALADDPEAATTADEFHAQAARIGQRLLRVFDRDPGATRLLLFDAPDVDAALAERVRDMLDGLAQVTARYLENGIRRGFLREDLDVAAAARAINGIMIGRALDPLHGGSEIDPQRFAAAVGGLILNGVRR